MKPDRGHAITRFLRTAKRVRDADEQCRRGDLPRSRYGEILELYIGAGEELARSGAIEFLIGVQERALTIDHEELAQLSYDLDANGWSRQSREALTYASRTIREIGESAEDYRYPDILTSEESEDAK